MCPGTLLTVPQSLSHGNVMSPSISSATFRGFTLFPLPFFFPHRLYRIFRQGLQGFSYHWQSTYCTVMSSDNTPPTITQQTFKTIFYFHVMSWYTLQNSSTQRSLLTRMQHVFWPLQDSCCLCVTTSYQHSFWEVGDVWRDWRVHQILVRNWSCRHMWKVLCVRFHVIESFG